MDLDELRSEYRNMRLDGTLSETLGIKCANCGSTDNIEYHHIVPLFLGGSNSLRNIVPLCNRCHKVAHRGRHMSHYQNLKNSGRRSNVTDAEAFVALDKWADGQIGNKKCAELLGVKRPDDGKPFSITQYAQYNKWLKMHGYEKVKNILDSHIINGSSLIDERTFVVYIYHIGSPYPEGVRFHDTGENDDVLYKVRGTDKYEKFSEIQKKRKGA